MIYFDIFIVVLNKKYSKCLKLHSEKRVFDRSIIPKPIPMMPSSSVSLSSTKTQQNSLLEKKFQLPTKPIEKAQRNTSSIASFFKPVESKSLTNLSVASKKEAMSKKTRKTKTKTNTEPSIASFLIPKPKTSTVTSTTTVAVAMAVTTAAEIDTHSNATISGMYIDKQLIYLFLHSHQQCFISHRYIYCTI